MFEFIMLAGSVGIMAFMAALVLDSARKFFIEGATYFKRLNNQSEMKSVSPYFMSSCFREDTFKSMDRAEKALNDREKGK